MNITKMITYWLILVLAIIAIVTLNSSCSSEQLEQADKTLDLAVKTYYVYSITESGK